MPGGEAPERSITMSSPELDQSPLPASPPPSRRTALDVCLVLMALGSVVWFNYYLKVKQVYKLAEFKVSGEREGAAA